MYIIENHIKTSRIVPNNSMILPKYIVSGLEMQEIIEFLASFQIAFLLIPSTLTSFQRILRQKAWINREKINIHYILL